MDLVGAMSEVEWNNYNGMYSSTSEEANFMAQLLGNCSLPSEIPNISNLDLPVGHESNVIMAAMDENSMYSSDDNATNQLYCFSQGGSSYSGAFFPSSSSYDGYYYSSDSQHVYLTNNSNSMSMDYCMVEAKNTENLMDGDDFLNQDASINDNMENNENMTQTVLLGTSLQLGRDHEMPMHESPTEETITISPCDRNAKKRSRIPSDVQKNKRRARPKENQSVEESPCDDEEAEKKVVYRRQHSMSCSEDDSNASQEPNGLVASSSSSKGVGTLNLTAKTRASRGSATDPQSLYARKRREKINERLRILQNLVPNGTKVDISTMLEEAVQYVKFLQLQIKLLSSDDMWMYAPIAYNGMDLGLDLKIDIPKS